MPVIAPPTTTALAPKSRAFLAICGEEIPPSQITKVSRFSTILVSNSQPGGEKS